MPSSLSLIRHLRGSISKQTLIHVIVTYDYTRSNRFPVHISSFVLTKSFQRNRVLRHCASRVARQLQWRLHRSLKPGWPVKPQVVHWPIAGMKAGTATQGRGIVVLLLNVSTSPNPSSSSPRILLPLTSCWRIGLRFSVMETVQVMCSFLVWVC